MRSAEGAIRFLSLTGSSGQCAVAYGRVRDFQLELLEQRARDEIPDTVLFLEHEPVVTRGRGLQFTGKPGPRQMPLPGPLPPGMAFAESERGGDLTYHGPGQLVIYPICKLDGRGFGPDRDVSGFIRRLEQILIDEIAEGGIAEAGRRESATGVWVGDRKVASIGIAVRKWVTYHGLAVNVVNGLEPFHLFSPCGFQPEVMTRLKDLMPGRPEWTSPEWRGRLESRLARRMGRVGESPLDLHRFD